MKTFLTDELDGTSERLRKLSTSIDALVRDYVIEVLNGSKLLYTWRRYVTCGIPVKMHEPESSFLTEFDKSVNQYFVDMMNSIDRPHSQSFQQAHTNLVEILLQHGGFVDVVRRLESLREKPVFCDLLK